MHKLCQEEFQKILPEKIRIQSEQHQGHTDALSDNFSVIDYKNGTRDNDVKNTKGYLCVTALIAIKELVNESLAFRASKQPLNGCPSNKIKVWTQDPIECFSSYQKKKTNPFPT